MRERGRNQNKGGKTAPKHKETVSAKNDTGHLQKSANLKSSYLWRVNIAMNLN
jgi:hypothetical protein